MLKGIAENRKWIDYSINAAYSLLFAGGERRWIPVSHHMQKKIQRILKTEL
jgi:hypothetical protein